MSEVKRLLATSRLLTLTGSGGCGKTRLAVEVGVSLVTEAKAPAPHSGEAPRFADGIWFVELAPLMDQELVPDAVAAVFGLRPNSGRRSWKRWLTICGGGNSC